MARKNHVGNLRRKLWPSSSFCVFADKKAGVDLWAEQLMTFQKVNAVFSECKKPSGGKKNSTFVEPWKTLAFYSSCFSKMGPFFCAHRKAKNH